MAPSSWSSAVDFQSGMTANQTQEDSKNEGGGPGDGLIFEHRIQHVSLNLSVSIKLSIFEASIRQDLDVNLMTHCKMLTNLSLSV